MLRMAATRHNMLNALRGMNGRRRNVDLQQQTYDAEIAMLKRRLKMLDARLYHATRMLGSEHWSAFAKSLRQEQEHWRGEIKGIQERKKALSTRVRS